MIHSQNIYRDDQWQKISMNLLALDMNRRQQIKINKDITLALLLGMNGKGNYRESDQVFLTTRVIISK